MRTKKAEVIKHNPIGFSFNHQKHDYVLWEEKINKERSFTIEKCSSDTHPHIVVTIPDEWPYVKIAPLYDVHLGSAEMDTKKFERDLVWLIDEPYVVSFNGGDLWDNAIKNSIASSFSNTMSPNAQIKLSEMVLERLSPKIMFGLPGNHEDRTSRVSDTDVPLILHDKLGIPYSSDYMLCSIKWRNNTFRLLAHHGTGASSSPGGQRNAARKDMTWAHGFDLYWTGHLHQPMVDQIEVVYFDQGNNSPLNKTIYSIISPSYLKYWGGYPAKKRLAPGARGMTIVTLRPDGRMDVESRANGARK